VTKLSVNLNKVALLRNQRDIDIPSVTRMADIAIEAGAHGVTVHPRPDQRHIRPADVYALAERVDVEFNIEGNPFPDYLDLVRKVRPTQATLVPDSPEQSTSDHGWVLREGGAPTPEVERLAGIVRELQGLGIRVSLVEDADPEQIAAAAATGADRVELYTEPWARAFGTPDEEAVLAGFAAAAGAAQAEGLGVNAGHDLNLRNLGRFLEIPDVLEVSIGHALVAEALEAGLADTVRAYLDVIARAAAR
jgi:pyridoxine 5-phosphate synthase